MPSSPYHFSSPFCLYLGGGGLIFGHTWWCSGFKGYSLLCALVSLPTVSWRLYAVIGQQHGNQVNSMESRGLILKEHSGSAVVKGPGCSSFETLGLRHEQTSDKPTKFIIMKIPQVYSGILPQWIMGLNFNYVQLILYR